MSRANGSRATPSWAMRMGWAIVLAVLTTACDAELGPRLPADRSVTTGDPCPPPCWQGIVPAETSREAAEAMLRASPFVWQEEIWTDGDNENGAMRFTSAGSSRWGESYVNWREGVVWSIGLAIGFPLGAAEVIDRFGEPEAVRSEFEGDPEHPQWVVWFYYPHRGVIFDLRIVGLDTTLRPSTPVARVLYTPPSDLERMINHVWGQMPTVVAQMLKDMHPWRGYGDAFSLY